MTNENAIFFIGLFSMSFSYVQIGIYLNLNAQIPHNADYVVKINFI